MNVEQKNALKTLRIAKGQIEATIKMIEEERYCVDVSNQIMASQSLLKKANLLILKQHINHCVIQAFEHDDEKDKHEKVDEVLSILAKIMGK